MFELLASMIDSGSSLWWLISSLWICKQICGLVADRNVLNLYSVVGVLDNISDQSHDGGRSRHRPRSIGPLRGPPHNRSTPPPPPVLPRHNPLVAVKYGQLRYVNIGSTDRVATRPTSTLSLAVLYRYVNWGLIHVSFYLINVTVSVSGFVLVDDARF